MSPVKGEPSSPKQSPTSSSGSTVAPKRQAVTARSTKARDKEEETKTAPTTAKRKPAAHHRYSSGSVLLDLVVGGGLGEGYAPGKLINVVGDKSSGKTLLACEIIAAAYDQHGTRLRWVYDDCESGFTFNTQQLYGVEIMPQDEDERTKSGTVEQAYCNVRAFLESLNPGQPGIYVIDSLDGLTSKEQDDRADERFSAFKRGKDLDKGSYQMGKAKYLSQEFFPQLSDLLQDKAALLIIISQTRDKIDSLFKEQTRSGGKAMDFYAHTVLWLSVITKYKKLGRVTGIGVKAHAKKSKTPRPFRFCDLSLLFDYGLDNVGSALDYLFSLRGKDGQLLQSASRIMWEGEELTVQGLRALLKPLAHPTEADVDMYGWIKEHVSPKFNLEEIREWLDLQDQKDGGDRAERAAIQALCKDRFGVSTTRAELIQKAEEDPAFQAVLLDRVRKQWEAEEEKVRSGRQPKYGRTSG